MTAVVIISLFQCAKTFLNVMAHISKDQTVQYILTMVDDILQVSAVVQFKNLVGYKSVFEQLNIMAE